MSVTSQSPVFRIHTVFLPYNTYCIVFYFCDSYYFQFSFILIKHIAIDLYLCPTRHSLHSGYVAWFIGMDHHFPGFFSSPVQLILCNPTSRSWYQSIDCWNRIDLISEMPVCSEYVMWCLGEVLCCGVVYVCDCIEEYTSANTPSPFHCPLFQRLCASYTVISELN